MRADELRPPSGATRPRRRVARGNAGRGGTYAGRGRKGQNARSGGAKAPYFEGGQLPLVRRLPYRRGFNHLRRVEYAAVNVAELDELFAVGTEVTPDALYLAGALKYVCEPFKVLAGGTMTKALTVHAPRFSAAARQAIEAAGGRCVVMEGEYERTGLGRRHSRR